MGAAVRLIGTVQEVTELRTAEQRVGRSTQRYLDLVSIAPVGVGVFFSPGGGGGGEGGGAAALALVLAAVLAVTITLYFRVAMRRRAPA